MVDVTGNDTHDSSLFRHWMDEVRDGAGAINAQNGRNSFYSLNGRAAVSTIATALGKSMQSVFQTRGLSSMLSPDLMEMFGDHEDRNIVEAMVGGDGYFSFEQFPGNSTRYTTEAILDGQSPSYFFDDYNGGSPEYVAADGANAATNRDFSNHWRPILLMANEQTVKEAIADPLRAALGFHFKASNYAMFSATNPAHPYRAHGVRYGYAQFNTYPKHFLDYGQFELYPAEPEWAPAFGITIPVSDPAEDEPEMHDLMLKLWWWNIRACRGSGRPQIPTITHPGWYAEFKRGADPDKVTHKITVTASDIQRGYEMLVRAGHSKIIQFAPPGLDEGAAALPPDRWDEMLEIVDRAMHLADQLHGGWRSRVFLSRDWR